ncbi:hypothetical protein [Actinomadura sp. 9N215]
MPDLENMAEAAEAHADLDGLPPALQEALDGEESRRGWHDSFI